MIFSTPAKNVIKNLQTKPSSTGNTLNISINAGLPS